MGMAPPRRMGIACERNFANVNNHLSISYNAFVDQDSVKHVEQAADAAKRRRGANRWIEGATDQTLILQRRVRRAL